MKPELCEKLIYHLVANDSLDALNELVNQKLREGWELYGTPTMSSYSCDGRSYTDYAQAVTKGVMQ